MKKIDRKNFLKITGGVAAGTATGALFAGAPFLPFQWLVEWTQDQYVPPKGLETYLDLQNDNCLNKCQVSIRRINERSVQLSSKKGLCPECLNSLQLLYHPERVTKPLKKIGTKGANQWEKISWEKALTEIATKINSLIQKNENNKIGAINGSNNQASAFLMGEFMNSLESEHNYTETSINTLTEEILGGHLIYNYEKTDYVVSFGAKILEGWGESLHWQNAFSSWKEKKVPLVQIDTNATRTASAADRWVNIKPGTEAILALGIANHLITNKKLTSPGKGFADWSQLIINQYSLSTVARLTGVKTREIKRIAEELYRAKNPIAITGRGAKGVSSSALEILAVYSLNSLVKTKAVKLVKPSFKTKKTKKSLDQFFQSKDWSALFINQANPAYKNIFGYESIEKLKKSFIVSLTSLIDDTAAYADYILPLPCWLEIDKPLIEDRMIELMQKIDLMKDKLSWNSFEEFESQKKENPKNIYNFSFSTDKIKKEMVNLKKKIAPSKDYPLFLMPLELATVGQGEGLAYPYVLKGIPGEILENKNFYVHLNRKTARNYRLTEGESIKLVSPRGILRNMKVHLTDTIAPYVIGFPLGFGQKSYTKYGSSKGVNPKPLMSAELDPITGRADWWITKVKIS